MINQFRPRQKAVKSNFAGEISRELGLQEGQIGSLIRASKPQLRFQQRGAVFGKERGDAPKLRLVVQIETFFQGVGSLGTDHVQSNLWISRSNDLERIQQNMGSLVRPDAADIEKSLFLSATGRFIILFAIEFLGINAVVHGLAAVSDRANIVLRLACHIVAYR